MFNKTMDIITTENTNPNTVDIDVVSSLEIARMINNEDMKVARCISNKLNDIASAIDLISNNFLSGGRLIYFGAGTSGRLGVLDASECLPTFNTPPDLVQGIIAGGDRALRFAIEGAEDSIEFAQKDFLNVSPDKNDTIVVISASGNANYAVKILELSKTTNTKTIAISCNPNAEINKHADIVICIETGAEAITGSTRMKAGSAQKMVLNMLSTGAMVRIGKTYKNFMVDMNPSNIKLKNRAVRICAQISNKTEQQALQVLENNSFKIKEAILQLKYSIPFAQAQKLLKKHNGILRKVFSSLDN